jgi:hypothetical protein
LHTQWSSSSKLGSAPDGREQGLRIRIARTLGQTEDL